MGHVRMTLGGIYGECAGKVEWKEAEYSILIVCYHITCVLGGDPTELAEEPFYEKFAKNLPYHA